ncbi:MAG TPA: 5-formyltetrahydrofolate cyclo-ligase [Candidatus Binatia bacterium]|jgi:5-formyltetrahydrofolate cyclo-ligase|nr:5-formyltetrahydrofolate cyclo-ligase [Candidatus Binatia bacterium]
MNKDEARQVVWRELRNVARPDSRFHLDFSEYIPDFEGSDVATARLTSLDIYRNANTLFITPDNCLERLRAQVVRDDKTQIVSTYGIRRGLVELRPQDVPQGMARYAVLLDLIEQMGRHLSLAELRERHTLDLLVTGASAVSADGIRFGKGHGFFDLEWAILYQLGIVDQRTPIVAFVHDCQVVDIALEASRFDTLCDFIVTPTRVIEIQDAPKPAAGVIWSQLEPGMMEEIAPLQELRALELAGNLAPRREKGGVMR